MHAHHYIIETVWTSLNPVSSSSMIYHWVTRRVPLVVHEQLTLRGYWFPLLSLNNYCGVDVAHSLVFCVVFCRSLLALLISVLSALHFTPSEFPFDICCVCSSLYTFWVPLWYLFCLFFTLHLLSSPLVSSNYSCSLYASPNKLIFKVFIRFLLIVFFLNKMKNNKLTNPPNYGNV